VQAFDILLLKLEKFLVEHFGFVVNYQPEWFLFPAPAVAPGKLCKNLQLYFEDVSSYWLTVHFHFDVGHVRHELVQLILLQWRNVSTCFFQVLFV
jgi:hypothetical protein